MLVAERTTRILPLAAEDELILLCSRIGLSTGAKQRVSELLTGMLDWEYVMRASIQHGVAPLLANALKQIDSEAVRRGVPDQARRRFNLLADHSAVRNQRLYGALAELATSFRQAGISVMALKDAVLAREVYPHPSLRPLGDVDLLIHREDYEMAAGVLSTLGFEPLPGPEMKYTLKYAWGHQFRRLVDNVWIDLQWAVNQKEWDLYGEGNFDFESNKMWDRGTTFSVDGAQMRSPCREDMLFHLCMHVEGHRYGELILFCDIAELLRRYAEDLDWDYFVGISEKRAASSSIYYSLFMAKQLLQAPVPGEVLQSLSPGYFKANLFQPLFGNLSRLHASLDELSITAAPPQSVMQEVETVVRQQARAAMQAFRELDNLATAFRAAGGAHLFVLGEPSPRTIPDPALPAFNLITFTILDGEQDSMRQCLLAAGFRPSVPEQNYTKTAGCNSVDPALASSNSQLTIRATITTRPTVHEETGARNSKKNAALAVLKGKISPEPPPSGDLVLPLRILALPHDELLPYLAARFSRRSRERMFGLCTLVEVFRQCRNESNQQLEAFMGHHVVQCSMDAVEIASGLSGRHMPDGCSMPGIRLRLFGSGRYDSTLWGRYSSLKCAFYFWWAFLSVRGARNRLAYLGRALFGREKILARISVRTVLQLLHTLFRSRPDQEIIAYWAEGH